MDKQELAIGDIRVTYGVKWIYAGKAGWQRIVEPEKPVINENKRDFIQWYMLSWIGSGNAGLSRSDALYQASIASEVYDRIEGEAKEIINE